MSDVEYSQHLSRIHKSLTRQQRRRRFMWGVGFNAWLTQYVARDFAKNTRNKSRCTNSRSEMVFPMLKGVDVAMRSETLNDGANQLLQILGACCSVALPKKDVTQGKRAYTEYYSRWSRMLFEQYFKDELAAFGYSFGSFDHTTPLLWLDQYAAGKLERATESSPIQSHEVRNLTSDATTSTKH